ncbi:MAG: 2OG-Fe(II) oxygenase [Rhodocyclaceae bacterium]|nr:2OG-Fe(II) oxygenase [Rhodocyclaceae bacterium]
MAHHDIFEQDAPGAPEAISVQAQFAANVYVQIPENGGELLMWNMNMAPQVFDQLRGNDYGLRVETLPEPDIVVKPGTGDLLIFDSRKMHAVAPPVEKSRLALSCFVAYRGDDKPLTFWS